MKLNALIAPALLALTFLAACGGGGGGGGGTIPPVGPSALTYVDAAPTVAPGIAAVIAAPTFVGTADTFAITAGALPNGLAFNPATGAISGTPLPASLGGLVTVTASLAGGTSDTFDLTFTVNVPSARALFSVAPFSGTLSTHYIEPTAGFLRTADLITGLNSPIDLALTADLAFLYVTNSGNGTIQGYAVDAITAELTELAGSPFAITGGAALNARSIAVSKDGDFLYTGNSNTGTISGFAIASSGALTELAGSPFGTVAGALDLTAISIAAGDFLYVAASAEATERLQTFSIGIDGTLTKIDSDTTGDLPYCLTTSSAGDFLWVGNRGDGTVGAYTIAANGTLTEIVSSPYALDLSASGSLLNDLGYSDDGTTRSVFCAVRNGTVSQFIVAGDGSLSLHTTPAVSHVGAQMAGMAVAPGGDFAFVTGDSRGELYSYSVGATGLTNQPTLPIMESPGDSTAAVVLPSVELPIWRSDAIYVANTMGGSLVQFSLDPTGDMSLLVPSSITTAPNPEDLAMHNGNGSLYASHPLDSVSPLMTIPINSDGTLDALGLVNTAVAGNSSTYLGLSPGADFIYVLGANTATITPYPIDANGTVGAPGTTASTGVVPTDIVVDITGRSAFAANLFDNTISQFDLDQETGAITAQSSPTLATPVNPRGATQHVSGRFLYTALAGSPGVGGDFIGQLNINPVNRALSFMGTSTVAVGTDPFAIASSPTGQYIAVSNQIAGTIETYLVNTNTSDAVEDGRLLILPSDTETLASPARRLEFNMDGTVLYVSSETAGLIEAFSVDSAGLLTPLDSEVMGGTARGLAIRHTLQ
ncbi:MAG: 6-phosphogluconolactonase (cycloisomerase 2 family) [Planctomycetota bacterium]|jgi:6-phosphogluconolactonase (cycloisomerase 2 family)